MFRNIVFALTALAALGCHKDVPTVQLKVAPPVRPGSVPIHAAVTFKGPISELKYRWSVNKSCNANFPDPNAQSPVLEIGDDCAGKVLVATVAVSSASDTITESTNLTVENPIHTGPPPPPSVKITINVPQPPSEVAEITGTAGPMSAVESSHLWLVVNPMGDTGHWPQGGPLVPKPPNGVWERKVRFKGQQGQRFNLSVVRANAEADKSFRDYIADGDKNHSFPAQPLPTGAQILETVLVTLGGDRDCMAIFEQPPLDSEVPKKDVPVQLSVTRLPTDRKSYYVVQKKDNKRFWYKGQVTLEGPKLKGRIRNLGSESGEHITLSLIAVNDEAAKRIEAIRAAAHKDNKWPELQKSPELEKLGDDECASVEVVRER